MDDLAVNHNSGRRSDAIARDSGVVGYFFDGHVNAELFRFRSNHLGRCDATFASRTQHLDVFHDDHFQSVEQNVE